MFIITNKYKKIIKLLKLDKPLIIFDIETTGLALSQDRIVQLAYIKIWREGKVKKEDLIFNPEIEISAEATEIHGIKDKDVQGKPRFKDKANELWETFNDCYYSGFNIMNFDLPMIKREFIRVGLDFVYKINSIIDTKVIYQGMVSNTLSNAYKYYCRKNYVTPYSALADADAATEVLVKQLEKYNECRDWNFLNEIHKNFSDDSDIYSTHKFYWREGEAYFSFSKYKDMSLAAVAKKDPDFLKWILEADFSDRAKAIVKKTLEDLGSNNKNKERG
ncbi:MAG: 3'-5' exonuclease [Patescibacteria group bacterium]